MPGRIQVWASLLIPCIYAEIRTDTVVKRVAHSLFDDTIEKAMRLQEERSVRPGRGNKQLWYVSAACSLVRIKFDPDRADTLKHQAGDRVSKILYKILSLQDDPSEHYLANEVSFLFKSNARNTNRIEGYAWEPTLFCRLHKCCEWRTCASNFR